MRHPLGEGERIADRALGPSRGAHDRAALDAETVGDLVVQVGDLLVAPPSRAPGFSIPVVTEGNA